MEASVYFVLHFLLIFLKMLGFVIKLPYKLPVASHCFQGKVNWSKAMQFWPHLQTRPALFQPGLQCSPQPQSPCPCHLPLLLQVDLLPEPVSYSVFPEPWESRFLTIWIIFLSSDAFHPHSSILHSFKQYLRSCNMDHIVSWLYLLNWKVPPILQAMLLPQASLTAKDRRNLSLPWTHSPCTTLPLLGKAGAPVWTWLKTIKQDCALQVTTSVASNKSIKVYKFQFPCW